MRSNAHLSFKCSTELLELIDKAVGKLNEESNIVIGRSDFIRAALERLSKEIRMGELDSTELFYKR